MWLPVPCVRAESLWWTVPAVDSPVRVDSPVWVGSPVRVDSPVWVDGQSCLQELELPEWGSLSGQSSSFQVPVMGRRCFQQPTGVTEAHRAQHWEH